MSIYESNSLPSEKLSNEKEAQTLMLEAICKELGFKFNIQTVVHSCLDGEWTETTLHSVYKSN